MPRGDFYPHSFFFPHGNPFIHSFCPDLTADPRRISVALFSGAKFKKRVYALNNSVLSLDNGVCMRINAQLAHAAG
jgi:hypothetical protein